MCREFVLTHRHKFSVDRQVHDDKNAKRDDGVEEKMKPHNINLSEENYKLSHNFFFVHRYISLIVTEFGKF